MAFETPSLAMSKSRLARGFRFHPTDEELVVYYLRRKVYQKLFRFEASEPWELQGFCAVNSSDREWHFFTRPEKKYANGVKINRSTRKGFWKASGKVREVYHNSEIIATKKTLVYHEGRAPYGRTEWVMHEYKLAKQELEKLAGVEPKDAFLLCKIYMKKDTVGRKGIPLNEEDWENDADILVPCEDGDEDEEDSEVVVGFKLSNVFNSQEGASSQAVQLPEAKQGLKSLGIRESEEDEDEDEAVVVCLEKRCKKPKMMMFDLFPGGSKGCSESSSSSSATIIRSDDSQSTKATATPAEFSSGLFNSRIICIRRRL